jgi:diguanylate cyclase (GGDEF)-like protein
MAYLAYSVDYQGMGVGADRRAGCLTCKPFERNPCTAGGDVVAFFIGVSIVSNPTKLDDIVCPLGLNATVSKDENRRRLALVCDSLEDNFQSALVDAALAAADAHGTDLFVVPGGKLGEALGKNFIHELVPKWVDGVIVAAHTIGHLATEDQMADFLDRLRPIPTVTLGEVEGATCCLSIDNEGGSYELTQHLLSQHGYERFVYLSGPMGNAEARARAHGFARALRDAGLSVPDERWLVGDFTWQRGRTAVAEFLDQRGVNFRDVQALVCANDAMAAGACVELERRGFLIPRDIAVVGFDDTDIALHLPAPLTTMRQPLRALLFEAVRLLVEGFETGTHPSGVFKCGVVPVYRRSCGCPRIPNLPRPSTPAEFVGLERVALHTLEPELRGDLDEAFVAALDRARPGWLGDLLEALDAQLKEQGTTFYDALETLCLELLRRHVPTDGWQDTLLVVRRHVARADSRFHFLPHLDRVIEGAIRLSGEVTTSSIARQRDELLEHLRVLSDATARLLAAPDLNTIAEVARSSFPRLGVERGALYLFETCHDGSETSMVPISAFGLDDGRKSLVRSAPHLGMDSALRGRSWVVEPLGNGPHRLGLAVLQSGLVQASWYERLRDALTAAINGARLMQQVQGLVITDPLTGLNNRRHFTEKMHQELRVQSRPLSLLMVDLDGFKSLNDERGHDEGDRALIEAARSIRCCLRDTDSLARIGGDEFAVALPGATAEQAKTIAGRILERLPLDLCEKISFSTLTCSVGIATVDGDGQMGYAELFHLADQALLAAKREGKNRAVNASERCCPSQRLHPAAG